jgi:hypothetical protein
MMAGWCAFVDWLWQPVRLVLSGVERTARIVGVRPPEPDADEVGTKELLAALAALELRLHEAVVAQERTNRLLEDALRAGREEDERARRA